MMSRQVIIIGGDAPVKSTLRKTLRPSQGMIQQAADNTAALKPVSASRFDLIVICENTSSQGDVESSRTIRRIHPQTHMLILTGKTTPADVFSAMRGHAFTCFPAPYSPDSLAGIVRRAIEEPRWDDGIEILPASDWVVLKSRSEMGTAERILMFTCSIKDPGDGFSLEQIPHAAVNTPPGEPSWHLTCREASLFEAGGGRRTLGRTQHR